MGKQTVNGSKTARGLTVASGHTWHTHTHTLWETACRGAQGKPIAHTEIRCTFHMRCRMPGLGLTAVGARRGLLSVPGLEEDVGMVGVHLPGGRCIELTPWWGDVEWSADGWGRWWITAKSKEYEALVEATCEQEAGAVLRCVWVTECCVPLRILPLDCACHLVFAGSSTCTSSSYWG